MEKEKASVRKRGWVAITVDILEATLTPQRKTRIMYKANLNYDRFNKYFYDFVRKGFIVEEGDPAGNTSYMISERGRTFLAALRKAQNLFAFEE
ncbi:MAG: winged helix-turn-helix domain-containing protein [Candidatus Bathyarchaeia archaeon]|jgi:predicted transcriptional regulator